MQFLKKYGPSFLSSVLLICLVHCHNSHPEEEQNPSITLTPKQSPYDHTNRGLLQQDSTQLPSLIGTRNIKPHWLESYPCKEGDFCHQTGKIDADIPSGSFGSPENNFWILTNKDQLLQWNGTGLARIPIGLITVWTQIDVFPSATPIAWLASINGDVARCTLSGCELKKRAASSYSPLERRQEPTSIVATSENTVWMTVTENDRDLIPQNTAIYHFDGNKWEQATITGLLSAPFDVIQIGGSSETDVWAILAKRYTKKGDFTGQVALVRFDGKTWKMDSSLPENALFDPYYIQKTATDRWLIGNSEQGYKTQTDELVTYQWDEPSKTWKLVTNLVNLPLDLHILQLKKDDKNNLYLLGRKGKSYQIWTWNGTKWSLAESSADFTAREHITSVIWDKNTLYVLGQDLSLWSWKNGAWNLNWDPDALDDQKNSFSWIPKIFYATPDRKAWLSFCIDDQDCRLLHGSLDQKEWQEYQAPSILSMWGIDDQNMWFGTKDHGLYHFNGKQFTHYRFNDDLLSTKEGHQQYLDLYCGIPQTIESLQGTSNQDIWAISKTYQNENGCLLHFDGSSWAVIKDGPEARFVFPVAKNHVWALDQKDLWHFHDSIWEQKNPNLRQALTNLFVDKQGTVWFQEGTYPGPWSFSQETFQKKSFLPGTQSIATLRLDQAGSIWGLGNYGSVFKWNDQEQRWIEKITKADRAFSLIDFNVWSLGEEETWVLRSTELYIQKQKK